MSYFGSAVLARYPRRLEALECVAGIDSFADVHEQACADRWRLGYVDSPEYHDPGELARQLVVETGAPAIALYINDGEYAIAACCSPRGNTCEFYLDERAFLEYCADFDEEDLGGRRLQRNDEAVGVLLRWASEAGLTADPDKLTVALATGPGQPDDGVQRLVEALGISH
jgi:hypothetical protein